MRGFDTGRAQAKQVAGLAHLLRAQAPTKDTCIAAADVLEQLQMQLSTSAFALLQAQHETLGHLAHEKAQENRELHTKLKHFQMLICCCLGIGFGVLATTLLPTAASSAPAQLQIPPLPDSSNAEPPLTAPPLPLLHPEVTSPTASPEGITYVQRIPRLT